jgi:DNA-binding MarR family transcriptional regulator
MSSSNIAFEYDCHMKASLGSRPTSISFLLTQIGADAAARYAARLASLQLQPPHAGVLRMLAQTAGVNQQELAERLGMHASRLVGVVDTLEKRGLVERKSSATDRRENALYITPAGRQLLQQLGSIARAHDDATCEGLSAEERAQLRSLLERIAQRQGLAEGVHPGYRTLRPRRDLQPE